MSHVNAENAESAATASNRPTPKFDSVLIANRGEIATRIMRTASREGLRTIAVYSDADRHAPHVRAADSAVRIGPGPARDSYLSIPALLKAAEESGAQAVHPGYGFLSERAEFAAACADAGLVFIGPSAEVIELMGRKDSARQVAIAAGVPVLPAVEGEFDDDLLTRALDEIGLPLLVKASAGGGGKGMRIVRTASELSEAVAGAKREAAAAFGDDTILIERYVEHGRHIEVQILADSHGNIVHLRERDCSTQRRHQKVLEEAPAPTISQRLRRLVTTAAVDLARVSGYVNAGTVEFLADGDEAFLLEMNTRLQVEHPVTELLTGLDLVSLQLLIAQGEPLPFTQDDVVATGHSIEARVYAEDPAHGFLPQAGTTSAVRWPTGARVDAALEPGQPVSTFYDPMLGKIIVHAPTREAARRSLVRALDETVIFGLTTNVGFLRRLTDSVEFRDCSIDTAWLDRHAENFTAHSTGRVMDFVWIAAGWAFAARPDHHQVGPFATGDGWRVSGPSVPVLVELELASVRATTSVHRSQNLVERDGRQWSVREVATVLTTMGEQADLVDLTLEIDGHTATFAVQNATAGISVGYQGQSFTFTVPDRQSAAGSATSDGQVLAPMPGSVISVSAVEGQSVTTGEVLAVMEAMKMEHPLAAPTDGTVSHVNVAAGDQVSLGQILFMVDPRPTANGDDNVRAL
ncbi:MAG: acetyl/propionyl-CoA carboxylase, alpha subunit [Pseudonocardiales bacterium]|nr:acetyl/propionyl-CoA carboxylase, alpha subunit [Pseudonocardiales bacterium]